MKTNLKISAITIALGLVALLPLSANAGDLKWYVGANAQFNQTQITNQYYNQLQNNNNQTIIENQTTAGDLLKAVEELRKKLSKETNK